MRANIVAIVALYLLAVSAQQTYQLVWSDEFNGNSLDTSKWQYEVNCDGGGNNELQCYTSSPSNVAVRNGTLVITAIPQNYNGKQYTSGRINTARSAAWKYGRIDYSAKIPGGIYLWPALWMMPRDNVYGGWAASGEIDIMETRGGQNTQESTLHFGGAWPNNVYQGSGAQTMSFDMTADFHLYSAIWTPESIQFLIDNRVYYTQSLQRSFWSGRGNNPYTANGQPFDQYFYAIINLAVGGGFFGANANSLTPAMAAQWKSSSLVIDYVRVYQLSGTPSNNPTPSPSSCTSMFNGLQCRTTSQDASQVDSNGVTSSRNWLCSAYPQYCSAINSGGQYSGCNSVEQLSYAMNLYYAQFGASQGTGACSFGGIGKVVSGGSTTPTASSSASTPSTTTSSGSPCSTMYSSLSCRTASQNPSDLDASAVSGARNWLCNNYGQFCTALSSGGQYSSCNSAEQLSYAMNGYYAQYGASQGANACNFNGVGRIVTPGVTQQTPCQSMYSSLKCRTTSSDPTKVDNNALSSARSWLCSSYPQFCTAVISGGQFSTCNSAEQISYAMNQYYSQFGASQGNNACNFGGLGTVV